MVSEILIFILAGFATGIITGLVGASAIVIFVPLILLFLDYNIFTLIGISLALDVFVSLGALFTYKRYEHIDFKTGFYISILAVVGAIVGSYVSKSISNLNLLGITSLITAFTGIILFRRKTNLYEVSNMKTYSKTKFWIAIIASFFVGFLGGSLGAAGGITILLLLIFILNFETHSAIGTSIFVMFFIALFGSIAHIYYINQIGFKWGLLIFAIIGGILGSFFSAKMANLIKEKNLNKVVGVLLFLLGIATFLHRVVL
ncbi:MAG TPA: sulfite exporter TauE/SafE family protein [Candidatus Pacearchaeota archaeon]|nr:sulfite exporter TauE/SafE family protein [Candidatus Pacearchaeota archaeon]